MEMIKHAITDEELQKFKKASEDAEKIRFEEAAEARPEGNNRHDRRKAEAIARLTAKLKAGV